MIHTTPAAVVHPVLSAQPAAACRPHRSSSWKVYCPAIWDRSAITMTSAAMIPQPPIQPTHGPKARAAQVNVVPQSGSGRLSSA
jgi:hypothetical protein